MFERQHNFSSRHWRAAWRLPVAGLLAAMLVVLNSWAHAHNSQFADPAHDHDGRLCAMVIWAETVDTINVIPTKFRRISAVAWSATLPQSHTLRQSRRHNRHHCRAPPQASLPR